MKRKGEGKDLRRVKHGMWGSRDRGNGGRKGESVDVEARGKGRQERKKGGRARDSVGRCCPGKPSCPLLRVGEREKKCRQIVGLPAWGNCVAKGGA